MNLLIAERCVTIQTKMKRFVLLILFMILIKTGIGQSSLDSLDMINPIGHSGWVTCSKIRGNILYTGSSDKKIKLWDLKSKKELLTFHPGTDIISAMDVTGDGRFIVSAHQNNYVVIQRAERDGPKWRIEFSKDQFCESVYFPADDSLIIATLYNSFTSTTIQVINFYSKQVIQQFDIPFMDDRLLFSDDRNNWFFVVDDHTVLWNFLSHGSVKTKRIEVDFKIKNFTFDHIKKEVLVYGGNKIKWFDINGGQRRELLVDLGESSSDLIDHVIPLVNDDFLVFAKNRVCHYEQSLKRFLDLGFLASDEIEFTQNSKDSTIYISSDNLYHFDPQNKILRKVFSIGERESINFNCSEKYFSVEGPGIRIYDRYRSDKSSGSFFSQGKGKFSVQLSSNGKYVAIQNSSQDLEIFSLNDFSTYQQLFSPEEIIEFRVSNNGNIYVLDERGKIVNYVFNHKTYKKNELSLPYGVLNFTIKDSLSQIWVLTSDSKLVKYRLDDLVLINNKKLIRPVKTETIISNELDSYLEVDTDNVSYCELKTDLISKGLRKSKYYCAIVPEGAFSFGLSDDGKYLMYIDSSYNHLNIVDVGSGKPINVIDIHSLDEIIDVAISDNLDMVYFSTFDDTVYAYKLHANDHRLPIARKYNEVRDLKIDEVNKMLLLTSDDGNLYVANVQDLNPIFSMYGLLNGGYMVKLQNSPFYMCSKYASKLLHYVTPGLRVIGFDQLDPVYNRPEIVLDSIGKYFSGIDKMMLSNYRMLWEKRIDRLGLDKDKLGKGEIVVPLAEIVGGDEMTYDSKNDHILINVAASDPKYNLLKFNVYVNEAPLYGSAGISLANLKKNSWDTIVSVPLSVGENKIQVAVVNELGLENFKYPSYVNYIPESVISSKTYFIGIGINQFDDKRYDLKYCVKDINDLATSFSDATAEVKLLINEEVTRENILQLKEYLSKTTVNDRVIISCSSHGLLDDSLNFYLAMHDMDFANPGSRGLKYEEMESLLDGIPARQKLLLLDACNSGENDKKALLKKELQKPNELLDSTRFLAARGVIAQLEEENYDYFKKMNELFVNVRNNSGSVIISAAGGQESALEAIEVDGKAIENGAFTYSVLEYLRVNRDKKDALTVNKLKQYVEDRVEAITNGKQKPTSRKETMEVDWRFR